MQRTDQQVEALVNQRLRQQRESMTSRLRSAIRNVAQTVDNNFDRSESWCLKLIRNTICFVLPSEAAREWEKWINQTYQKYKSSNWKWVVRILIGALIGWLLGQLLIYAVGQNAFVADLVATYKWIKPVVLQFGSKILSALGAVWNSIIALFKGV